MTRMIGKNYYRIQFILESPLSVGSGENEESDKDVLVDSHGVPFIPASSLTGVYREALGEELAKESFGRRLKIDENAESEDGILDESRIITYDAVMENPQELFYIRKRDMVHLDEYKTAIRGCKFDFQVLEPGVQMVTYIEENIYDGESPDTSIHQILSIWKNRGLCFGTKTKRGYGKTKAVDIKKIEFPVLKDSSWLDFDIYDHSCWSHAALWKAEQSGVNSFPEAFRVEMKLKQKGGISVREYSTNVDEADYSQMTLKTNEQIAVIPGTTWAGAFRAQMKKLGMGEQCLEELYGSLKGNTGQRSKLSFSESQIPDGTDMVFTRNAIDRFTGGTITGALYKEKTRYLGTTALEITCASPVCLKAEEVSSGLAATIMDLHYGFLAIGGLTSIGRGLFEITELKINGDIVELKFDVIKTKLKQALQEASDKEIENGKRDE